MIKKQHHKNWDRNIQPLKNNTMPKDKKKKALFHASYNKKKFLAPDSILSMAAIHTKIKHDGEASIRISDCNRSIKIWNDLNDKNQTKEMLLKLDSLISVLSDFRKEVEIKNH